MKKYILLALSIVLVGAIMSGVTACGKPNSETIFEPSTICYVCIKTIPGEEMILLAKSKSVDSEDEFPKLADFEAEYGAENISVNFDYPVEFITDPDYGINHPDAVPNCYEITMAIDISKTTGSPKHYWFPVVKIVDDVLIGKIYGWAFTENGANSLVSRWENTFKNNFIDHETIIGITAKNLGLYVEEEQIIFQ